MRVLGIKDLEKTFNRHRSTLYRTLFKNPTFPKRRDFGGLVGWLDTDIEKFLAEAPEVFYEGVGSNSDFSEPVRRGPGAGRQ